MLPANNISLKKDTGKFVLSNVKGLISIIIKLPSRGSGVFQTNFKTYLKEVYVIVVDSYHIS